MEESVRLEEGPPPDAHEAMMRGVRIAIALTAFGVGALWVGTDLPLRHSVGIPLFYLFFPALAVAQLPLLRLSKLDRIPVYLGSGATILFLGTLGLALGIGIDGPAGLGLRVPALGPLVAWTLGITAFGVVLVVVSSPLDRGTGWGRLDVLSELLPRTPAERRVFVGLSCAAGWGEELAYRGYALAVIQLLCMGPWAAAGVSSVAFAVLHAYQGPVGLLRTGLLGFVLALPVLLTGSVLPSILAHALIDVIVGLVIGPRLIPSSGRNLS